ncbi:MAG: Lrp/AsnC ligand binding domain-containing protein [Sulfolobales archaeon]|nr:Lrp/AsnC ligand binding domain-containing protein [Sulfolobales archaeon]MDW8083174.1 Lrp/AsnC ligand binding domain-containing protein [Sulfolobales archaeon]
MGVRAYMLITTATGSEYEVLEDILKMSVSSFENVKVEADVVYGVFDLVIIVEAPDLGALDRVVTQLRSHSKITKTTTLISSRSR